MTIRHPAKVKNILASGVDSLVISMDIAWRETSLFAKLDELKEKAKQDGIDHSGNLKHFNKEEIWPFTIKPHGTRGFSWILSGSDFSYKIANSLKPTSRPNVMVEIRSETLWRIGPEEAMKIALGLIELNGGCIINAKLSRVDLCLDFIMPENLWSQKLLHNVVTRAMDYAPYYRKSKLTGIRIGKGVISARLYDKPLEIKLKSKKEWMFDIWQIAEAPEGKKIIRIEFQLRREALKELGLSSAVDLLQKAPNAWAYCTKKWLKFRDRVGLHHTQRSTLDWYKEIQNGFNGVQGAKPLIREKAVCIDKRQLLQQANGLIESLHAINMEEKKETWDKSASREDCLDTYIHELSRYRQDQSEVRAKIIRKRSKYHREEPPPIESEQIYKLRRDKQ